MTGADRVAAAILLLFSAFVTIKARALPYWTAGAPGPGFLPFWLGVLLGGASVALFVTTGARARPREEPWRPDRRTTIRLAMVVGLTAGAAALSLVTGMVIASGIFMAVSLAYLRPGHARANWTTALLTPAVVWLLFVRWLGVPLPAGPFGF